MAVINNVAMADALVDTFVAAVEILVPFMFTETLPPLAAVPPNLTFEIWLAALP
jgi:hypothetical protein